MLFRDGRGGGVVETSCPARASKTFAALVGGRRIAGFVGVGCGRDGNAGRTRGEPENGARDNDRRGNRTGDGAIGQLEICSCTT